jgi:hypothetical protein
LPAATPLRSAAATLKSTGDVQVLHKTSSKAKPSTLSNAALKGCVLAASLPCLK